MKKLETEGTGCVLFTAFFVIGITWAIVFIIYKLISLLCGI